jgi:hypothetical protein
VRVFLTGIAEAERESGLEFVMITWRRRQQHRRVRGCRPVVQGDRAGACAGLLTPAPLAPAPLAPALFAPALLAAVLVLACAGCEESLPPRVDPVEVLRPDVQIIGNTISLRRFGSGTNLTGGDFRLSTTNLHDEVLSGEALIRGTVALYLKQKPDSVRILDLGPDNLVRPSMLVGSVLTIGVNERVELLAVWNQRTDGGTPFWMFPLYHEAYDSKGRVFYQSDTVYMSVTTSMQVFEKVQALKIIQREIPVVYELYDMALPPPPD